MEKNKWMDGEGEDEKKIIDNDNNDFESGYFLPMNIKKDDSRFPSARDVKDRPDYDEGCEFIQDSLKTPIPIGKP
ncbi:18349_t:CDS:2 [Entrophospora sp. SA101]|nr:18349_t:CDS:2 [Entrophospora sp. SA101]